MALKHKLSLVSLAALSVAMPALAQESTDGQTAEVTTDGGRDVVIITANKREESVQDIAVAITAVTSEQREELGIASMTDLTNLTPGLQYTAGNERVALRGIGRNTNNFGAEPGVANYTDGIYQSFATIAGRDNLFVDRIEVVRGPQGTLYGRNSVGGALNIISKRPTDTFEAEGRLAFGNFEHMKIGASVSGPITDSLRYRVVGYKEDRDEGVFTNYATGDTEGYQQNNHNWEVQLEGDIGDRFTWWTKYTTGGYHQAGPPGGRTTGNNLAPYDINSFGSLSGTGAVTPNQFWAFGNSPTILGFTQTGSQTTNPALTDIWGVNANQPRVANLDAYDDFALEAVYSFDNFDVKYLGGYIYYDYNLTGDQDGSPITSITYNSTSFGAPSPLGTPRTIYPEQTLHYKENRAFFSNEVNFISTNDSDLQWIGGLYLYQENFSQPVKTMYENEPLADTPMLLNAAYAPSNAASPFFLAAPNPERLLSYTNNMGLNNSYGAFGQIDWQFTETLKTTVGLRYSVDNKNIQEEARLFCYIQCSFAPGYLPYTDVTQALWNGSTDGFTGIQPGVASATTANPTGVTYNLATGNAERLLQDEWDAVTGTAGLEYSPTADTLVFGKYTRGYKTGGFNATSMSPLPRTKPETIDAFELGWKQEWIDANLTTNVSAFMYNYQDVQAPLGVVPDTGLPFTAFVNIPKVETSGFEIETIWRPIDKLNIMFNYAYLNPEISDGGPDYADGLNFNTPTDITGNKLPNAAENKIALNASYMFEFEDGSTLLPSISYYWRDSFTTSLFNNPEQFTPDYNQTDARLIWNDANGHFTVIGWVRNAFDETGYDGVGATRRRSLDPTQNGQIVQSFTYTQPRTFGVELQFHWK